jgi:hypothetical protein
MSGLGADICHGWRRPGSAKLHEVTDPVRHRPPECALRWAAKSVGAGCRVTSVQLLTEGGWHANHALTVVDRGGRPHRLVLRRWARPDWQIEDPDFTAEREACVLGLLSDTPVPAPVVVAADPEAAFCDAPALLLTRLPGRSPGLPGDMDAFLTQLAEALTEIHAVDGRARELIPAYHNYYDPRSARPPAWLEQPAALGARDRGRVGAPARWAPLPHPSRLPPRERALVPRSADRDRRLDHRVLGTRGGRHRAHALKPGPQLWPRRRRGVPAPPPLAHLEDPRRPALLGHRHRARPRPRDRSERVGSLRSGSARALGGERAQRLTVSSSICATIRQ